MLTSKQKRTRKKMLYAIYSKYPKVSHWEKEVGLFTRRKDALRFAALLSHHPFVVAVAVVQLPPGEDLFRVWHLPGKVLYRS